MTVIIKAAYNLFSAYVIECTDRGFLVFSAAKIGQFPLLIPKIYFI